MKSPQVAKSPAVPWHSLPDEQLLKLRIRDLHLAIDGSWLVPRIAKLHALLKDRALRFRPPCYLADEWLCPDKNPVIGIPFYLAHPRLKTLEKKLMLSVEGGTDLWCMRLLCHECGHAINYAYRFFARARWRELFGPFSAPYTMRYWAQPYSRRYVIHLQDNYAQAHPDEDFAETFAVWLSSPVAQWQKRYKGWPALEKLEYVDALMKQYGGRAPVVTHYETLWSADQMRGSLGEYYDKRRKGLGEEFPGFYDPGLLRIFAQWHTLSTQEHAASFLRRYRSRIVKGVSLWTGDRKYDTDKLLRKLTVRCKALNLFVHDSEENTLIETVSFVTAVMARIARIEQHGVMP